MNKDKSALMNFDEMVEAIIEEKRNGFDEAVFVGRLQMNLIVKWAYLNQRIGYLPDPSDVYLEAAGRPEVGGLPVYVVNAHSFFKVA